MAIAASAQPAFDVVSIKHVGDTQSNQVQQGNTTTTTMRPLRFTPTTFTCKNTVIAMLREAYQVKSFQIQGPGWLDSEVYDVSANMPDGTSRKTARLMIETMLANRLGLKLHREQKEFSVLLLSTTPGAKKLEQILPTPPSYGYRMGMDSMEAIPGIPMSGLAGILSTATGRTVLDETGLSGYYKVKLQWNAEPPADDVRVVQLGKDSGVISALPQLGLRLEPAKRTMDNLVVEKINKEPTEN
jgi:uncharacterized protein (TIGR03435 family)